MSDNPQERSDRSRMRRKRDVRAFVVGEYVIKQLLHAGLDYKVTESVFSYLRGIVESWTCRKKETLPRDLSRFKLGYQRGLVVDAENTYIVN